MSFNDIKNSFSPMLQALCVPNLFGENTPEEIKKFLNTDHLEKVKNTKQPYRFTFYLQHLDFKPEYIEPFLQENLKYGVVDSNYNIIEKRSFYYDRNGSIYEYNLVEKYLKPLIFKLKSFEEELKKMEDEKLKNRTQLFINFKFTFIMINESAIREEELKSKSPIHKWHIDKDVIEDIPARQFAILLTKHPNTEFTNLLKYNLTNTDKDPKFQCPKEDVHSTSYWNNKVYHRKPMYNMDIYEPVRSMCSIMFYFNDTKDNIDYYNSAEHFEKEKEALNHVFGNISLPFDVTKKSLTGGRKKKNLKK